MSLVAPHRGKNLPRPGINPVLPVLAGDSYLLEPGDVRVYTFYAKSIGGGGKLINQPDMRGSSTVFVLNETSQV